jgi:hypothetical protein
MFISVFLLLCCLLPQGIISNSAFGEAHHTIKYEQPGRLRIYTSRTLVLQDTANSHCLSWRKILATEEYLACEVCLKFIGGTGYVFDVSGT